MEWEDISENAICKNCGHLKMFHSDFEASLGNDSHECQKEITIGRAIYKCTCKRFEDEDEDDIYDRKNKTDICGYY